MAVMAAVHWAVICARVWSDRVWRDSHSSCKSSPALLLKMEQHTILSLSICLPLSLWPPSLPHPCSSFYCLTLFGLSFFFSPVSSVNAPSSPSPLSMPRPPSVTDRQRDHACGSVTEPSGTQWPQLPHRWSDKWLNEPPYTLTRETWGRLFFLRQGAPVLLR